MTTPAQRLNELGLTLPVPAKPVANYVGWTRSGNLVFTAGQLPLVDGKVTTTGTCGAGVTKEDAHIAARLAAVNVLAQVNDACGGDLSRVKRLVKLTGFVACNAGFADQPYIVNGASNLMVEVLGDHWPPCPFSRWGLGLASWRLR